MRRSSCADSCLCNNMYYIIYTTYLGLHMYLHLVALSLATFLIGCHAYRNFLFQGSTCIHMHHHTGLDASREVVCFPTTN
jgi:hypothetical protein